MKIAEIVYKTTQDKITQFLWNDMYYSMSQLGSTWKILYEPVVDSIHRQIMYPIWDSAKASVDKLNEKI